MRSSIVSVTGRQIRLGLALLVVLFACFVASDSHAQGGPTGSASSKPVPPRYNDDMNSCLCNCAGAEAGWECGVMDGPRCYYNPVVPPDEICGGAGPCLFSGWGCERGSPSAKCEDDCFNEVVLKPLCAEAVAQFGLPETATEDPSHLRRVYLESRHGAPGDRGAALPDHGTEVFDHRVDHLAEVDRL